MAESDRNTFASVASLCTAAADAIERAEPERAMAYRDVAHRVTRFRDAVGVGWQAEVLKALASPHRFRLRNR